MSTSHTDSLSLVEMDADIDALLSFADEVAQAQHEHDALADIIDAKLETDLERLGAELFEVEKELDEAGRQADLKQLRASL